MPSRSPQGAPTPERQRVAPGPTAAAPAFETVQPPGSLPPQISDSPFETTCSSRPSGGTGPGRVWAPAAAQGAGTDGGGHDARSGRDSASWELPAARGGDGAHPGSISHRGAGFRDRLEALSATHDLEVAGLRDEVAGLQDLVVRYQSLLDKRVPGELLCAAGDGLTAYDPTQQIAGEMCTGYLWRDSFSRTTRTLCKSAQPDATVPKPVPSRVTEPKRDTIGWNNSMSRSRTLGLKKSISSQASVALPPAARRTVVRELNRHQKAISRKTCLKRCIDHGLFDLICAVMILNNSVIIGFEVQWLTTHEEEPALTKSLQLVCSAFFFFELVLRVLADGPRYFFMFSENRNWNWFDLALVVMSCFDIMTLVADSGGQASSIGMGFKTIKMLRIVRVVRVFRFFTKLSQLALMIIDSVKSLVWALVMLGIVIYVFAIFFTHYTTEHVKLQEQSGKSMLIDEHFGDLWLTIYTLFHSTLNGISWHTIPTALYTIPGWTGPFLALGFVGYLSFTMLAVMNIITGVFVDNAVETAKTQREFLVQKEMEVKEQWLKEMRKIFKDMDADGSGTLSKDEVGEFCNDDRVHYYLTALGLDVQDTEKLYDLLDENNDGELEMDEFLSGCLRLKGVARSIDVFGLIQQSRLVCKRLEEIDRTLHESMEGKSLVPSPLAQKAARAALRGAADDASALGPQAWGQPRASGGAAEGWQAWSAVALSAPRASG